MTPRDLDDTSDVVEAMKAGLKPSPVECALCGGMLGLREREGRLKWSCLTCNGHQPTEE